MKILGTLSLHLFAAAVFLAIASHPAEAETLKRVQIRASNAPELATELERSGFDVLAGSIGRDSFDLVVTDGELALLVDRGYAPTTLAVGRPFRDIQAERDAAARAAGATAVPPGYPNLAEILNSLATAAATYPAICEFVDLTARYGTPPTVEGRHLYALKISDNVSVEEDEPAFLLVADHHAREIVTPVIALHAVTELTSSYGSDPAITALVDANEIWIAPVWNPDGYEHVFNINNLWRKNRRVFATGVGVDINRNYPQGWSNACSGSTSPSSETYKGPAPASEAETQTMIAWSLDQRFAKVIDYHSSGRELLRGYACWTHPFDAYLDGEAAAISLASGYGGVTRDPSADGEHYQWQFATMGAYAFLAETHTEFQPSYTSAQTEAALVWPGALWMLDRAIPLWGHVTDAVTGSPVVAAIQYEGVAFQHGEENQSGGADGRYHAFLPAGTYSIRFTADGYEPLVIPGVQVASAASTRLDAALTPESAAIAADSPAGGAIAVSWQSPLFRYRVAEAGQVTLRVVDVRGSVVATLVDQEQAPGQYAVAWQGRNQEGRRVARGSYFYHFETAGAERTGKLLLAE